MKGIMYDVESLFSESVVSHLARILFRRGTIEDSSLCLCFRPAPGRRCTVGNRSLHGGGTAQAAARRRHGVDS